MENDSFLDLHLCPDVGLVIAPYRAIEDASLQDELVLLWQIGGETWQEYPIKL